jgi:hypothetical protein
LQAFSEGPSASKVANAIAAGNISSFPVLPGWDVYNPYRELERLGVLSGALLSSWRGVVVIRGRTPCGC